MCAAKAASARTGERQHAFTTGLSLRAASLPEGSASRDAGGGAQPHGSLTPAPLAVKASLNSTP